MAEPADPSSLGVAVGDAVASALGAALSDSAGSDVGSRDGDGDDWSATNGARFFGVAAPAVGVGVARDDAVVGDARVPQGEVDGFGPDLAARASYAVGTLAVPVEPAGVDDELELAGG